MRAETIRKRFREERDHIEEYLAFFNEKAVILAKDVECINIILRENGIRRIPFKTEVHSYELASDTVREIAKHVPRVEKALDFQFALVMADIESAPPVEDTSVVIEHINIYGQVTNSSAIPKELGRKQEDLGLAYAMLGDIKMVSRSSQSETVVNIHRQAFILLMTVFDAAVADLMRAALANDFFTLIKKFPSVEKLSMHDLGEKRSFQKLQRDTIDAAMTGPSLNDLLSKFDDLGAHKKDPALAELIYRRHLHIHRRGAVDQQYIAATKNACKLRIGQVAAIDKTYLEKAIALTQKAIEEISEWIEKQKESRAAQKKGAGKGKRES